MVTCREEAVRREGRFQVMVGEGDLVVVVEPGWGMETSEQRPECSWEPAMEFYG